MKDLLDLDPKDRVATAERYGKTGDILLLAVGINDYTKQNTTNPDPSDYHSQDEEPRRHSFHTHCLQPSVMGLCSGTAINTGRLCRFLSTRPYLRSSRSI